MIVKNIKFSGWINLFLIAIIFSALILPVFVSAEIEVTPGKIAMPGEDDIPEGAKITEVTQIVDIVKAVLQWVYYIFFIIAAIYVVLAAYAYLGEGEDAEKLKTIHKNIMWAAIAIAVALISVGINAIVKNFISP